MPYRQKNFSLSEDQRDFIKNNYPTLKIPEIARQLNTTYNVVHNNMRLMGLVQIKKQQEGKLIEGMFDIQEFSRYYNF